MRSPLSSSCSASSAPLRFNFLNLHTLAEEKTRKVTCLQPHILALNRDYKPERSQATLKKDSRLLTPIMVQTRPISKTILSLDDLEERFNLRPTEDEQFFPEWIDNLPDLSDSEIATLDEIKHRFYRHRKRGSLAEGTINQLLISPLLTLAGLYDDPFYVTTEPQVEIILQERDELLRGRIDTLIIQDQFWVLVIESKSTIAFAVALPQSLTYMLKNPNPECPVYGMVTNGDECQFIKVSTGDNPQYDLSNIFSLLLPRRNQLYDIMRVLKNIKQIMLRTVVSQ